MALHLTSQSNSISVLILFLQPNDVLDFLLLINNPILHWMADLSYSTDLATRQTVGWFGMLLINRARLILVKSLFPSETQQAYLVWTAYQQHWQLDILIKILATLEAPSLEFISLKVVSLMLAHFDDLVHQLLLKPFLAGSDCVWFLNGNPLYPHYFNCRVQWLAWVKVKSFRSVCQRTPMLVNEGA